MISKKRLVAIGLGIIIIGGLIMVRNPFTGEEKDFDKKVAENIAKSFSKKYLDPNDKEVSEITFYEAPNTPMDFTGSRFYVFYINRNKSWKVTASVKDGTDKITGYGSDYIDLKVKPTPKNVSRLRINYWED